MATFEPKKYIDNDFNNGIKYENGVDSPNANDFNQVIESQLWVQKLAENQPNVSESSDGKVHIDIEDSGNGTPRFNFKIGNTALNVQSQINNINQALEAHIQKYTELYEGVMADRAVITSHEEEIQNHETRIAALEQGGSSGGDNSSIANQVQSNTTRIGDLETRVDAHETRITALDDGTTALENRITALEQGGSSGGGGVSSDIAEKVEKINEALGRVEPAPNDIHFLTLENMQGSISNLDLAIETDGNGGSLRLNRIEDDITGLKDNLYNQDSSGKVDYTNPKFERRLKGDTLPEVTSPDPNLFGDFFTDNNGKKYILKNIDGTVAWKAVVTEDMLSGSGVSDSNKTAYLHVFEFYNAPETFYIYVVLDTPALQGKSFFENPYLFGGEIPKYPLWASMCMDDINTAFGETAKVTLKATSVDNVEYKFAVNDNFIANMTLVSETGEKVV